MILGFGVTETTTARNIINECLIAIKENKDEHPLEIIETIREKYNDAYEANGEMNRSESPQRYSCFWVYESGECLLFNFHHINRRHPFSPDGWAMMKAQWVLNIKTGDIFSQ